MEASRSPQETGPPGPPDSSPRRGALIFGGLMLVVIAVVVGILVLGGDDEDSGDDAAADGCETVEAPAPKQVELPGPEAEAPSASTVVFETSCGSFTVTLDAERAPKTAASFEYLAAEGAYDGTPFHRVAPGFVVQGGDPSGDGTGGPGYSVTEKPPGTLSYTRGLVAMAKTGAEPPGTSGSQFFVVTAEADAGLPPDYALVGEVTEGYETIEKIEALGSPGTDGPPSQPVVVESATPEG
jgi:cyclophilin family peptidyl-prolyl cis-trans isomerase